MSASRPDDIRLETIKAEGRRRRACRHHRNLGFAAIAVVVFAGAGILATQASQSSTSRAPEAVAGDHTASECHNSTAPNCGPFRWSPAPAENRPVQATIHPGSGPTAAGQATTVTVTWSDPDATRAAPTVCWGDDTPCPTPPSPCDQELATGAWSPPVAHAGRGRFELSHTYAQPGTYAATVTVVSHAWPEGTCPPPAGDPYTSTTTVRTEVTVR